MHRTEPSWRVNAEMATHHWVAISEKEVRRCPTLPQGPPCSTIGAKSLSFRVRNVTGRFPLAMAAETLKMSRAYCHTHPYPTPLPTVTCRHQNRETVVCVFIDRTSRTTKWTRSFSRTEEVLSSYRLISTGQLHRSLVPASTSCLSTQSSGWEPLPRRDGNLISKTASRLDAFSGYPVRT